MMYICRGVHQPSLFRSLAAALAQLGPCGALYGGDPTANRWNARVRGGGGLGRPLERAPRPAAPHGGVPARPAAAGTRRRGGRRPGGVPAGRRTPPRLFAVATAGAPVPVATGSRAP